MAYRSALMFAHERFAARPTVDIDFMGDRTSNDQENIKRTFMEICSIEYPDAQVAESAEPWDFCGGFAGVEVPSADGAEVGLTACWQPDWSDNQRISVCRQK